MQDCRQETINGLNEYLGHLKAEAGVHYRFSLTQFDSHSIDNLYVDLGKPRYAATTHDLRDTLEAIVQNRPMQRTFTAAVGCHIPT